MVAVAQEVQLMGSGMVVLGVGGLQFRLRQELTMWSPVAEQELEVAPKVEQEVFSQEATAHLRETMVEDGVELKRQEEQEALQHPFQAALEV
jgi:hypothetical protein